MATKPLQSIKFPGLDDRYTVPQVDSTLQVAGAAADAKKTGDEIGELNERLGYKAEQTEVDDLKSSISEETRNLYSDNNITNFYGMELSNGKIVNTQTDTRSYLVLGGILYDGSTLLSSFSFSSSSVGRRSAVITPTSDVDAIIIRHSGQTRDLGFRVSVNLEANTSYVVSVYIDDDIPTTVGRFVVEKIQIEQGSTLTQYIPHITATDYEAREDIDIIESSTPITLNDIAVTTIPANSDLDNYQTVGNYKVTSSGMNISNAPANEGGRIVVSSVSNSSNIIQFYISNSAIIYYRIHNASGWSDWSFLLNKAHLSILAPIASPTFTGTPKAPTASAGTVSTQIATTAFTMSAVNAIGKPFVINNSARATLQNGSDFNNLTTEGNWNISSSTAANTMVNIPITNPGSLVVITTASTNNITQIYICTNQEIYIRFKDGGGWHPWNTVAKGSDTIRASQIDKSYFNYFSAIKTSMTYDLAFANAPSPIQLYNYRGNVQNVHPKVLYFSDKFGGHYYWMAYTPYPYSLDKYENPCVAYSDDGYTWTNISANPLDDPQGGGYNSDTHLVYRSDTSTLECWYRYVYQYDSDHRREKLYRQTTTNGTTWSAKELVLDSQTNGAEHWLSPAIIFDGTNYNMWVVDTGVIKYYTASPDSITTWTLVRTYSTLSFVDNGVTYTPWHLDIVKETNRYILLVMCRTASTSRLFICTSQDNETYSSPYVAIGVAPNCWDDYIYRSCIVYDGSKYRIYYSAKNSSNIWGMAISESTTLENFNGILI